MAQARLWLASTTRAVPAVLLSRVADAVSHVRIIDYIDAGL